MRPHRIFGNFTKISPHSSKNQLFSHKILSLAVKMKNSAVLQLPPLSSDNLLIMDMITDKSKRNDMDNIDYINLPHCLTIHM